jgi:hypothetical protein
VSWQSSLPYTLTVDIFDEVGENNEGHNTAVIEAPVPTPVPCMPTTTSTPSGTPTACRLTFTDVPSGQTFYNFVRCLACRGLVSG